MLPRGAPVCPSHRLTVPSPAVTANRELSADQATQKVPTRWARTGERASFPVSRSLRATTPP